MTRAAWITRWATALLNAKTDYDRATARNNLEEALALPPDPVPRRLTAEDFAALLGRRVLPGDHGNAGFLNARIFGS